MSDYILDLQRRTKDAQAPEGKNFLPERKTAKLNKQRRALGLAPVGPKVAAEHGYVVRK